MIIVNILIMCAALAAFWILVYVWLDLSMRTKDHRGILIHGDDPRADKSVDPVVKFRDCEWYPVKE